MSERRGSLLATLRGDLGRLLGIAPERLDAGASFVALGADSLLLLRVSQAVEERFGVRVPFRRLMEEVDSLDALAAHLDRELPPPAGAGDSPAAAPPAAASSPPPGPNPSPPPAAPSPPPDPDRPPASPTAAVERILGRQLELMREQLRALGAAVAGPPDGGREAPPRRAERSAPAAAPAAPPAAPARRPAEVDPDPYLVYRGGAGGGPAQSLELTRRQREHVAALIERLTRRTATSRRLVAEQRPVLADSRGSSGFRRDLKQICYQIMVERARGARLWDVDGNEYVDLTMGFGSLLFGHSPPFVVAALERAVADGVRLGPLSPLAGEVARRVRELTGVERVAFLNSGTEAVMTALRLARAVTGRDGVALFSGSYHGTFDGVLARPSELADGGPAALPQAPGIPRRMVADTVVLEFGDPAALAELRRRAPQLAAVLVEPQQRRRPELDARSFIAELRSLTAEAGTALIFDEVITGFRTHPGGAQARFGVVADLVTYGKALGGGMPIGAVAGRAAYMDAIDGGAWEFDDGSYPAAQTTIFRGTFFKHPLVMAAADAVLRHLAERGPSLQQELDRRTVELAAALDRVFDRRGVPVRTATFSSLFTLRFPPALKALDWDLFFYHLLEQGVYVWEGRACYLSTAHTDADLEQVVAAAEAAVDELQAGGFLGGPPRGPGSGRATGSVGGRAPAAVAAPRRATAADPAGTPLADRRRTVPLTPIQRRFLDRGGEPRGFVQARWLEVAPPAGRDRLAAALRRVVEDHAALRHRFERRDGVWRQLAPGPPSGAGRWRPELTVVDLSALPAATARKARALAAARACAGVDPGRPPLLAAVLFDRGAAGRRLLLAVHHLVCDHASWTVLLADLEAALDDLTRGRPPAARPEPTTYGAWALRLHDLVASGAPRAELGRWLAIGRARPAAPAPGAAGAPAGGAPRAPRTAPVPVVTRLGAGAAAALAGVVPRRWGGRPHEALLAALAPALAEWAGGSPVLVDVEGHGREDLFPDLDLTRTVGWFTAIFPLLLDPEASGHPAVAMAAVGEGLRRLPHGGVGWGLLRHGGDAGSAARLAGLPRAPVLFGYLRDDEGAGGAGRRLTPRPDPLPVPGGGRRRYPLEVEAHLGRGALQVVWRHDPAVLARPVVERLAQRFASELAELLRRCAAEEPFRAAPATAAQRGLWALCRLGGAAAWAYNETLALQLAGDLDVAALRAALAAVGARHEALRTGFDAGGCSRTVSPRAPAPLPLADLSAVPAARRRRQAEERLTALGRHPFDLTRAPLLRGLLLRTGPRRHVLALVVHHLVIDAWSFGVLLRDLDALYAAARDRRPARLPAPVPFSDFARNREPADDDEGYWLERFADPPSPFELPPDRPRPPLPGYRGGRAALAFDGPPWRRLAAAAAGCGCTPFVFLLAGFCALMHRLSGREDLVIGFHSAGQAATGRQDLVGFCIRMLPLRSRLAGDPAFGDHAAAVRTAVSGAWSHQGYPFARLVRRLGLVRDPGRPPLVPVIFNYERGGGRPCLGDLRTERLAWPESFARFDQLWDLRHGDGRLGVECTYDRDLYDRATADGWLAGFAVLMEAAIADPGTRLSALGERLAAAEERRRTSRGRELKNASRERIRGAARSSPRRTAGGAGG